MENIAHRRPIMSNQSAEELILAAIIAEKRRQEKANKGKPTQEPVIPKSLQRAFNDL